MTFLFNFYNVSTYIHTNLAYQKKIYGVTVSLPLPMLKGLFSLLIPLLSFFPFVLSLSPSLYVSPPLALNLPISLSHSICLLQVLSLPLCMCPPLSFSLLPLSIYLSIRLSHSIRLLFMIDMIRSRLPIPPHCQVSTKL